MAQAGNLDRARTLAGQAEAAAQAITDPDRQAQILADIARDAEPSRAWLLLARALTTGHWLASASILPKVSPDTAISIADEYLRARTDR